MGIQLLCYPGQRRGVLDSKSDGGNAGRGCCGMAAAARDGWMGTVDKDPVAGIGFNNGSTWLSYLVKRPS